MLRDQRVWRAFFCAKDRFGDCHCYALFTEMYGTQYGMGYYIMDQWNRLDYLAMFGGIIVISVVSFLLFLTISGLERYCLRWQNK